MSDDFRVGKWNAFSARGVIAADEKTVQLEPRVMDLLVYLAEHSDEVLSKERLIQAVWPDTFVGDDVLTSAIWKLRQALGDDPKNPSYVKTLPRRGYQLVAEVVFLEDEVEESGERFRIVRKLGQGAMAEVHLAEDSSLGRKVALKFLLAELEGDVISNRRLRREARAAAALDHPFICKVYDTGTLAGRSFIAMEYIEGKTLKERLKDGPLPFTEVQRIASEIAEALEVAHTNGILHRDIKPSNILLTEQGHVKITDFGIAKRFHVSDAEEQVWTGTLTEDVSSIGTLPYMSPEQVKGEPLDQRSDLFSFGVVLYELLTGTNPFFRAGQAETTGAVLHEEPPPLSDYSIEAARFETCIRTMLAKVAKDRFQTASEVIAALQGLPDVSPKSEVLPYPGLAPFTSEQSHYFFGREIESEQLWKKLEDSKLLGLIGSTGSGKSSFIQAGLAPAAPPGWAVIVAKPGNRPFMGLAEALSDQLLADQAALRELFRFDDEEVALSVLSRWRRKHEEVLIAVDQFEELFTLNPEEEQKRFAGLLEKLVSTCDVHLLLSMRDDFLIRCHGVDSLEGVFSNLTPIGPLRNDALERALVKPAAECGYQFEDEGLVDRILEEVKGERGTLPLMAFAAAQLWDRRDQDRQLLTEDAYEVIGGVAGALSQHAEVTLEQIGRDKTALVRELFRNLVTAEGTRSVQDRDELLSVFKEKDRLEAGLVLEKLLDARLLVAYGSAGIEPEEEEGQRIEIVHESLLTSWPRLVRWQTEDTEGAQLRDELRQAAKMWDQHNRSPDLLWVGNAVKRYEIWHDSYPGGLTDLEEAFGEAMTFHARLRNRRRRLAVAVILTLALIAVIVTTTLWRRSVEEARRAEAAHLLALAQQDWEANPTDAVAYVTKSLELADTEPARLFATRVLSQVPLAYTLYPDVAISGPRKFSPDGRSLIMGGTDGFLEVWSSDGSPPVKMTGHGEKTPEANFSVDGQFLYSSIQEGAKVKYTVWRFPEFNQIKQFSIPREADGYNWPRGHPDGIIVFNRIGESGQARALLYPFEEEDTKDLGVWPWEEEGTWQDFHFGAEDNPMVRVADRDLFLVTGIPGQPTPPQKFGELNDRWYRLEILSDGTRFATCDDSMEINIWNIDPRIDASPRTFRSPVTIWNLWAFDPEGTWLATAHPEDKMGLVWDLTAPVSSEPMVLRRGNMDVVNVALHPDGTWVVAAGTDGVSFWPLGRRYPHILAREQGLFGGLAFHPTGNWLAAVTVTGKLRLWSLETTGNAEPKTLFEIGRGLLTHLSVSPDGKWLATGRGNGTIRLVPVSGGPTQELVGFHYLLNQITFDQTGRRIAASGGHRRESDALIRVWDLDSGEVQVLDPGDAYVTGLRFEREHQLYSSGRTGLRLWNLKDGTSELLIPDAGGALSPDGRYYIGTRFGTNLSEARETRMYDLELGTSRPLSSHGDQVVWNDWHPNGEIFATSSGDGTIRIGNINDDRIYLLHGHTDRAGIQFGPNGKWLGSAGADGSLRLWPIPDFAKPPFQTLPYEELVAKLKAMTNHRVVEDENSPTGYSINLDTFPGWDSIPEW
jgi:serine/threonine protein kinase/WD40 repeat protein